MANAATGSGGEAWRGGHVRVNGKPAKPSTPVRVGHRVEATVGLARTHPRGRPGHPQARRRHGGGGLRHRPQPPAPTPRASQSAAVPGAERPIKRDHRDLDRMRNFDRMRRR
ncbi:MAG: S4 domain-containing protein [Acidimicrobiales bacterium]